MNRKFTAVLIAVLASAVVISAVLGSLYYRESQTVKVELPAAWWVPIYFTVIDRTAELGNLPNLRTTTLDNDDIEVRVWGGFGLINLEGVVMKRTGGQWSAIHVEADHYVQPEHAKVTELGPPRSGWDVFWKRVTDQGLLTIRDPSGLSCDKAIGDAINDVVEINQNRSYRTYRYADGTCPDAGRVKEIGNIIGEEFATGHEECRSAEWFGCSEERRKNNLI
jgi:hypothetical protein